MKGKPPTRRTGGQVMAQVLELLGHYGIDCERRNAGALRDARGRNVRIGPEGTPDIDATLPDGRRLAIEAKAEGELPTPEQLERCRRLNELGGVAFWTDDVRDVLAVLPVILAGGRVIERDDGRLEVIHAGSEARGRPLAPHQWPYRRKPKSRRKP